VRSRQDKKGVSADTYQLFYLGFEQLDALVVLANGHVALFHNTFAFGLLALRVCNGASMRMLIGSTRQDIFVSQKVHAGRVIYHNE
jgi:hypothetical protein